MMHLDPTDIPTGEYNDLTPPLHGYWWETERQVRVPLIHSDNPHAFLGFIAAQEAKGKAVVFPCIINRRLDKLLRRRGYVDATVWVDYEREDLECLVLRPELAALKETP